MKKVLVLGLLILTASFLGVAGNPVQAADKEAYKIGGIFPLTGYLSWLGEYYKKGAELQVDLINKAGGVDGHPLKLISYDDKSSPENGSRVARRLISKDGVVALIGTATVPISGAVASVANKNKVPVLVSSGYAVDPKKEPYTFNTVHKTDYAVILPFKYFQKKGIKKLALLMTLGPLGELGSRVARKYAKDYGIDIVGEEKFDPKSPDLTAQLAKLRTLKPEAIFSFCTGEPAAKVARNMDQLGMDIPLLVSHGNGTPGFLKLVSGLKTKILVPSGKIMKPESIPANDPTKKVIMDFHQKHKEKYKEPANYFSGMTADSVALIAKGLQKVGKADPQKLRDAIESTKNFARMDGVYNMSESDHYGTKPDDMILLIVKDGKWEAAK